MEIVEPDLPVYDPNFPAEPINYGNQVWQGNEPPLGEPPLDDDYIGQSMGEPPMDGAVAPIPAKGADFDWSVLSVQTREDFDALSPGQQELLKMMKRGVKFTGAQAADFVMGVEQRIADPVHQARVAKTQAEAAQMAEDERVKREALQFDIRRMRNTIDELEQHPGFSGSVGMKSFGNYFPATKEADFRSLLDQLQGGVFMQAYQNLKGGGPITDIEGEKAEKALARLNPRQSEEGFRKAMNDFREFLDAAEARMTPAEKREMEQQQAEAAAGQPAATPEQSAPQGPAAPASVPAAPASAGQGRALPPERFIGGVKFILNDKGRYVRAN